MVEGNVEATQPQMEMDGPMAKVVCTKMEPLMMVETLEMDEPPEKWLGSQKRWLTPQWRRERDS